MLDRPLGTLVCPLPPSSPQATTVPSALAMMLQLYPAAIDVTLLSPGGTGLLLPHWSTVPSDLSARLFSVTLAAATVIMSVRLPGSSNRPELVKPHSTMLPSCLIARLSPLP